MGSTEAGSEIDISVVTSEYRRWGDKVSKTFGLEQALHSANLVRIEAWDDERTPMEIAKFVLETAPKEAGYWLNDRDQERQMFGDKLPTPANTREIQVRQAIIREMEEGKVSVRID